MDVLDGARRKRVYVSLHQTHLPQLHDAGIVDFDKDRGTVEPLDCAAVLSGAKHVINQTLRGASA